MLRKFSTVRRCLTEITFNFYNKRLLFPKHKMNAKQSSRFKNVFEKIEGMERQVYSILAEMQDVKKVLKEIQNSSVASVEKSISTSTSSHKKVITEDPEISSPNKLKRRKPIHDEIVDLDSLDFDDDDFTDYGEVKKVKNDFITDTYGYVQVYTDGACENNGKYNAKAGLGVWFGRDHPLNVSRPVSGRATNNVGEIEACTCAIKIASDSGVKKLCINTDSQFVINSMTKWIKGWKKKNWKLADGGPVKNKDNFIALDAAVQLIPEIKWNYVKAHCGIEGNEGADSLAKLGADQYIKQKNNF